MDMDFLSEMWFLSDRNQKKVGFGAQTHNLPIKTHNHPIKTHKLGLPGFGATRKQPIKNP